MKKLLYSIMALAGLTMASCTQEHIDVQYIPENAVAPTLGTIEGCDLSDGGADIVVEYTKADFGVATGSAHNLYISKSEDMADMKKAKASFTDNTITLTQADLNVVALDFAEAGAEVDMYFAVVANLNTDKGAEVAGTQLKSNVVKATFKSYVADVLPTEKFEKVWVIGNYCGWSHDKTQFLFDYNSTGTTFAGVVDFAGADGVSMAADGFKLTGVAGWDDTCNWGLEDNTTAEAEAASLQLITGGGSQDIKAYAKRFYGFEFDKTTLVLKKSWGADQIGIIGLNGDWETDIVMEYNAKWTRFYADIEAPADTEMKFRADGGWDLNWGVDCAQGGGNIPVAAGNYRVYFNPANGLIEFNASAYGKTEDTTQGGNTEPEPEGPVTEPDRWGVVGTITEWGTQADLYMSEVAENLFVRMGVTVTDADAFKVRFNNGWDINYGAAGDVEPFAVTVGEELALVSGGKNLSAPAGTYDIFFNIVDFKIWVMPEGEAPGGVEVKDIKFYADVTATGWTNCNIYGWGDLGEYGGTWPGTALSTETIDGKEYYAYTFDASAIGKTISVIFNNGSEQTVDIKDIVLDKDYIFTLTEKDANGKWLAAINGEAPVEPEKPAVTTYGLLGDFNGWGDDVDLVARGDGWYVTEALSVTAGKLLIRLNDAWDEKFGNDGSTLVLGENALTYGGADMLIEAGTYDFYFNPTTAKLFVVAAGGEDPTAGVSDVWTIKGDLNSTQWTSDIATEAVDGFYVAKNVTFQDSWGEGANFKVLKNGTWMGATTGGTHNVGDAIAVSESGGNITMNVTLNTPYDIYIDGANNNVYVVEAGATPAI